MGTQCGWAAKDPLLQQYHDQEWGVPTFDRQRLFEFLVLEGAQAGLSWLTVLKRRDIYRDTLADFDPTLIAGWDPSIVNAWMSKPGLIHNAQKLRSILTNAQAFIAVEEEFGDFHGYLVSLLGTSTITHAYMRDADIPAYDEVSKGVSRDLVRRGFRFVGPTICYSYLEAVGMINDHLVTCHRYPMVMP